MKGPGYEFEAAIARSVPRGVYFRKMKTPAPPVPTSAITAHIERLASEAERLARASGEWSPEWRRRVISDDPEKAMPRVITAGLYARYTPSPGYDFLFLPPAPFPAGKPSAADALGAELPIDHAHLVGVAAELKSVAENRLDWKEIKAGQESTLADAEARGLIAGVMIEFRRVGEVWFVPIAAWREMRLTGTRESLPLQDARLRGIKIHPDAGRGERREYLDLARFFVELGASLPERAPGQGKRKAAARTPEALGLFDKDGSP